MKLIKDLEIMTDDKLAEVEAKYKDTYGIIKTRFSDPWHKNWSEKYVEGVIGSKEEVEKIAQQFHSDEYVEYSLVNVLTTPVNE